MGVSPEDDGGFTATEVLHIDVESGEGVVSTVYLYRSPRFVHFFYLL